jgi:hypothetical protein
LYRAGKTAFHMGETMKKIFVGVSLLATALAVGTFSFDTKVAEAKEFVYTYEVNLLAGAPSNLATDEVEGVVRYFAYAGETVLLTANVIIVSSKEFVGYEQGWSLDRVNQGSTKTNTNVFLQDKESVGTGEFKQQGQRLVEITTNEWTLEATYEAELSASKPGEYALSFSFEALNDDGDIISETNTILVKFLQTPKRK